MLRFHREGRTTIAVTGAVIAAIVYLLGTINQWWSLILVVIAVMVFGLILHFFRSPDRNISDANPRQILAPADGKIVVVEHVDESEFLHQQCLQISIFMSPLNVHVNWNPISGKIVEHRHHPGKYLVAWHPKSSSDNERTTVVYETAGGEKVLVRQVAGAMARRIVNYLKIGEEVSQGAEMGFIKFGSRVDVLLPSNVNIKIDLNQKCQGNRTVLAEFPN